MLPKFSQLPLAFLLLPLFWSACQSAGESGPRISLNVDEMAAIMADAHLAEAYIQTFRQEQRDSVSQFFYPKIFAIHGVDEARFYSNLDAYRSRPEAMEQLEAKVIEHLQGRQGTLSGLREDERPH